MRYFLLFLFSLLSMSSCYLVNIKIIRDTNERFEIAHNYHFENVKKNASNYSGPGLLKQLVGQCFLHTTAKYVYRICPFMNVTQHEISWHSTGYRGVIGFWKEWSISNNSFDALVFTDGDKCDNDLDRNAIMKLHCGQSNEVTNITETKRCHYDISFNSPLACGNNYIYPHLESQYRSEWDQIETHLFYGELTQLGYETSLNELFIKVGIKANNSVLDNQSNFESKEQCQEKFDLLHKENERLKQIITNLQKESKDNKL